MKQLYIGNDWILMTFNQNAFSVRTLCELKLVLKSEIEPVNWRTTKSPGTMEHRQEGNMEVWNSGHSQCPRTLNDKQSRGDITALIGQTSILIIEMNINHTKNKQLSMLIIMCEEYTMNSYTIWQQQYEDVAVVAELFNCGILFCHCY